MLTLHVQYFAILREQRGLAQEKLTTVSTTPAALYEELRMRHRFSLPIDRIRAAVNGTPPFTYQWRKDANNIAGATLGSLTFSPIRPSDTGSYSVVITNAAGSATSGAILIAVTPATAPTISGQGNRTVELGASLTL